MDINVIGIIIAAVIVVLGLGFGSAVLNHMTKGAFTAPKRARQDAALKAKAQGDQDDYEPED